MNKLRERGFTVVEGLLVLLLVAAIVAAGWFVFNRMKDKEDKGATTNTSQSASDASEVNDTEDLDAVNKTLDDTNLDASSTDSSELDTELSGF